MYQSYQFNKAAIIIFYSLLNEKQRRLYAGLESFKFDKLVKKLEKALGVTLTEKVSAAAPPKRGDSGKGLTLGDFLKINKK